MGKNGQKALNALLTEHFDIAVLNINLPSLTGLKIVKTMRDKNIKTPVLILTAHDTKEARLAGLNVGADDYLTKPFDFDELCARIRALLHRSYSAK